MAAREYSIINVENVEERRVVVFAVKLDLADMNFNINDPVGI